MLAPLPVPTAPSGYRQCEACHVQIKERLWTDHEITARHQYKVRLLALRSHLEESENDRYGVVVTPPNKVDLGFLEVQEAGTGTLLSTVSITATTPTIKFTGARISSERLRVTKRHFDIAPTPIARSLIIGANMTMDIRFNAHDMRGRFQDRIELSFIDSSLNQEFKITRPIGAAVGVQADLQLLRPVAPYVRPERQERGAEGEIVPGEKPPALEAIPWKIKLGQYPIPEPIFRALAVVGESDQIERTRGLLPQNFDVQSYGKHFATLLHAEEHRMRKDLQIYDIRGAALTSHGRYYYLEVPGLAEKRPSVIVSDTIKVRVQGSLPLDKWFEGFVHVVREREVGLKFDRSFRFNAGQLCDVHFELGRFPLRRMHQGLDRPFLAKHVLFPAVSDIATRCPTPAEIRQVSPKNQLIKGNHAQMTAVVAILNGPLGSPPFIIFGPPGTGKTITMIESMHQILSKDPNARILACAPSNSAADLLADGLKSIGAGKLFRLNAPSRTKDHLMDTLTPFILLNDRGIFTVPPLAVFKTYKVVVSTCISAAVVHGIGVPRGHYTHIFIDESGQGMEPEVMVPIRTMALPETRIILSGDPKQLGPIIRSGVARAFGLATSYLERLMLRDVYDEIGGRGTTVVKLIQNYRSHPAILSFPNSTFYRNDLQAHGDPATINRLLRWSGLPKPGFPIVFHAIKGEDMREATSPSFFNPDEASLVKKLIRDLRDDRALRLNDSDFGVISPYSAQCGKLRALLRVDFQGIKVGTTEEFQGQERLIIIISTVRSAAEHVSFDAKHTLGFVANPRRFNVAITRAKALLILVGDPTILAQDALWRLFLNYIYRNGGWTGGDITWDPEANVGVTPADEEMDDLQRHLQEAVLQDGVETQGAEDDAQEAHAQRPWLNREGI